MDNIPKDGDETSEKCSSDNVEKSNVSKKVENSNETATKSKKAKKRIGNKTIKVNCTQAYYPLIQEVMESLGYKVTDSETAAHLFWVNLNGSTSFMADLLPWQFYNHFPGMVSITRKVELARNIENMKKILPDAYTFHPETFILPNQYHEMRTYMSKELKPSKRTFIIKPDRGSLGKGIVLVQDPSDLESYPETAVAQRYISPFLIDGLKFDLRIYVLVTSMNPLRIYIHNEGMVRFCTKKYNKPTHNNLHDVYAHLTNYSLNKKNENFQVNQYLDTEDGVGKEIGHKRSLSSVYDVMKKSGHNVDKLKNSINEVIRLTMIAAQPVVSSQYRIGITTNDGKSRCFEILGFDVMIDKNLKPWLLEVNAKPSMAADSEFDRKLKTSVISGALKIVDIKPDFKRTVAHRIQKLVQGKTPGPIFDPQVESELAKQTNWKQIFPIDDGDISQSEIAISRLRETFSRKKVPQNSASNNNSNTGSRLKHSQNVTSNAQSLTRTKTPPQAKSRMRSTTKIIKPVTKPIVKPPTPPVSLRSSVMQPKQSCPKLIHVPSGSLPIFVQMKDLPCNLIREEEERARQANIRYQIFLASSSGLAQKVYSFINPQKSHERLKAKPVVRNQTYFKFKTLSI